MNTSKPGNPNLAESTNLAQAVLDYIYLCKRMPATAVDPDILDSLERAALTDTDGAFASLTAPAASETWEAKTLFLGASPVSQRVQIDVPYGCILIGAYASLSVLSTHAGSGVVVPTVDDIDVSIDLNLKDKKTSADGTITQWSSGAPLATDGDFVTLGSVSTSRTSGGRLLMIRVPFANTQIGVQFRWKQYNVGTQTGIFLDTMVNLAFYVRPLQGLTPR